MPSSVRSAGLSWLKLVSHVRSSSRRAQWAWAQLASATGDLRAARCRIAAVGEAERRRGEEGAPRVDNMRQPRLLSALARVPAPRRRSPRRIRPARGSTLDRPQPAGTAALRRPTERLHSPGCNAARGRRPTRGPASRRAARANAAPPRAQRHSTHTAGSEIAKGAALPHATGWPKVRPRDAHRETLQRSASK